MDKNDIRSWLENRGQTREWMAREIGVSKGTVDQWFSKGFPEWAVKAIQRLDGIAVDPSAGLEVTFSAAEFERIEKARDLSGHPTRAEYYKTAITEFTDQILKAEAKTKAPTVIKGPFPETSSPSTGGDDHGLKAAVG